MTRIAVTRPAQPRLDPHALPPATAGRFLLLIATALAGSVQVYGWLIGRLGVVSDAPQRCVGGARGPGATLMPDALIDWYSRCEVWASLREAQIIGAMMLVFAVVTGAIWLATPRWIARGMTPLTELQDDECLGETAKRVIHIVEEHRFRRDPMLYADFASGPGTNRAFGRAGRYAIALDLALLRDAAARPDDPRLESVLRHELAHLRNRDIDLTYLTIAVWWGFLAAVALPFTLVAVRAPASLADFTWRIGIVLLLVWGVRAAVLRSREYYADVRSVRTVEQETGLLRALGGATSPRRRRLGYLAYHPTARSRVDVIHTGERLFRLSPGVAAAAGALVGLAFPPAYHLAELILPDDVYEKGWACGFVFGVLTAAVLTGAVWRAAAWAAAAKSRSVSTLPSAAAFTVALLGGMMVTPRLSDDNNWLDMVRLQPARAAAMAILLLGGVQLYLRWSLLCARSWLAVAGRPRLAYRFGVAQSAVVIGIWLSAWYLVVVTTGSLPTSWQVFGLSLAAMGFDPLVVLSIPWMCLYPLATWQTTAMARHASGYRWWRDGAVGRAGLHGFRTPLMAVNLTAATVLLLYGVGEVPLYPAIRQAVAQVAAQIAPTAHAYERIPVLLGLPAVIAAAVCGFALGVAVGGRDRTSRAVAGAGAAMLPASVGVLGLMLFHLTHASPIVRSMLTLLSGLSGIGGSPGDGRPRNAAIGVMTLAVLIMMCAAALPAAGLGSAVRVVLTRRAPVLPEGRRQPGRPVWLTSVLVAPLLAVGAGLGYLSWIEWRAPRSIVVTQAVDQRQVENILSQPRPTNVPLTTACENMVRVALVTAAGSSGVTTLAVTITTLAAQAESSGDQVLQRMGEGTVDYLRQSEIDEASAGTAAALHYCGDSLRAR